MSKALPRGIRLVNASPSGVICDSANLCRRNSVFFSNLYLRSSSAVFHSITNRFSFLFRNLVSNAFFSVLHCSVLAHIKLVISMCSPSQVINAIVSWVSIVVSHVGKTLIIRNTNKSNRNESMGESAVWLSSRVPEHVCNVAKVGNGAFEKYWGIPPSWFYFWISPFSSLFAPRANLSKLVDFVMLKAANWFPRYHVY